MKKSMRKGIALFLKPCAGLIWVVFGLGMAGLGFLFSGGSGIFIRIIGVIIYVLPVFLAGLGIYRLGVYLENRKTRYISAPKNLRGGCSSCGADIAASDIFCETCGNRVNMKKG